MITTKSNFKQKFSLILALVMMFSMMAFPASANTTYTVTSVLDTFTSSNKPLVETVNENGSTTIKYTPVSNKNINSITIAADTGVTVTIQADGNEVRTQDFHATTTKAANNVVTLTVSNIVKNLTITPHTVAIPTPSTYVVTTNMNSYVYHNKNNVETVNSNSNLNYVFTTSSGKYIDYFYVTRNGKSYDVKINNGDYIDDNFTIRATHVSNGTINLELQNIRTDITITPILSNYDSNLNPYYPYYPNNPNWYNEWTSIGKNAKANIRTVQIIGNNKYIAEVVVRTTEPTYYIHDIDIKSGYNYTEYSNIKNGDSYFRHADVRNDITWNYDGNYETARFYVTYTGNLSVFANAYKLNDNGNNNTNRPNYTPKYNMYNMIKNEYDGTTIEFSEGSPIKENETTNITIQANTKLDEIKQVKIDIGNKNIATINKDTKSFVYKGKTYTVSHKKVNGIDTWSTSIKVDNTLTVFSYGKHTTKPNKDTTTPKAPDKPIINTKSVEPYVRGISKHSFAPMKYMTKAEAVTMLTRAFATSPSTNFAGYNNDKIYADVGPGNWYSGVINYAYAQNYLSKIPKIYEHKNLRNVKTKTLTQSNVQNTADNVEVFKPESSVTRAEFAALVLAFSKNEVKGYGVDDMMYYDIPRGFWAYNYIIEATNLGIVKGHGGYFSPAAAITRAEAVTMVNRALGRSTVVTKSNLKNEFNDVRETDWFYKDVLSAANKVF